MPSQELLTAAGVILDSLSDGVYVCDRERRIVFWSKAAARITGWEPADVVGRRCHDDVLCHIDKDGHRLCGEEFCPLHRAMVTGATSTVGLIVFARGKQGNRIPMQVTVAPIRDLAGDIIGGVETFRDLSAAVADLERAKRIQALSLESDLPRDARIRFATHYIPHDVVGGDYYGIKQLDADRYGFLLADVMGHGLAAALYTMHLSSLWDRYHPLLRSPLAFVGKINNELCRIVKGGESFAAAVCGLVDASRRVVVFSAAGNPPPLLVRAAGGFEQVECAGLPLGVMEDAPYDETTLELLPGDRLLLFSDGVIEIHNAQGKLLGADGLVAILKEQGYPGSDLQVAAVEEQLLKYSNAIRLEDDLTLIEMSFVG